MPIIAPPNPETRKITSLVTDLEVRMRRAEAGLRAAQLTNASIRGAGITLIDDNGNIRGVLGRQRDGSYTATSINNPDPPPVPSSPIVVPALASLIVRHTGETATGVGWPADLDHLNIYYAQAQNPDEWTSGGSLGTGFPEELPIAPLEYTQYLVAVTAVNHSGKESEKSVPVSGNPNQVVPNDLIQNIFQDLALSANSVTEAALAAGAVTTTKIADNSISSPKVIAGAILGVHILADQIDGGKLTAQAITAREIAALAVIAGKIDTNAVTAGTIVAGAVSAIKLEANLILGSRIIAGSASGNRVEIHPTQGIQAFSGGGAVRSFWLDAATGSGFFMGQLATATAGRRIVINPGNNNQDRIQFWPDAAGGPNDYAFIDSFGDGTTATGITMQASGGDTRRVGTVWVRENFAQLGIADDSLVATSQFYAEPNFVRNRSATVDLIVDQALTAVGGPRRVAFIHYDTSGNPIGNSSIYYGTATANQYPMLFAPAFNRGIIWDGGGYIAFVDTVTGPYARIAVEASEYRVVSDSRTKSDILDIPFRALDAVSQNPSKKWKRDTTTEEDDWQFGPMADNLPDEMVYIDPDSGMRKLGMVSMIGVLWKAIEELNAEIQSLRASKDK
jgi:hypothetical protein